MSDLVGLDRSAIRAFVESVDWPTKGRVLDYGCGTRPYHDIVEAAGCEYHGFDRASFPANMSRTDVGPPLELSGWDAILCTQVVQFVPGTAKMLTDFRLGLRAGGILVLTYPTNWPEVNAGDLWRFTAEGMALLVTDAGFAVTRNELKVSVTVGDWEFALGYGLVATA